MTSDIPHRLPSRPLRNWLLAWRIWTGDPPEMIARGFDLDARLVEELLGPRPPLVLERSLAVHMCAKLRLEPGELWADLPAGFGWCGREALSTDEGVAAVLAALC